MQKLYETWDQNMYVMLAVNVGEERAEVKAFMERNKYTFPVLLDKNRRVSDAYQIQGIPTTFLVDENGRIRQKEVGARNWDLEWLKI
jgi:peroxiredoxin